ncbi:hypothetical protein BD779DRAFT_570277 [Infundibulicybe gibba]|nr:hypothetical protein BD779DRAFT_570277 [Infundibulicybe gibba]
MSISSAQAFGAIEVGVVLAALANGVLALQVNRYFHKPGKDPLFLKLLILFIWLATVAHLFLSAAVLYILTIINYSKPIAETVLPVALPAGAGLGAFIHSSVQSIYTYRLHRLTDRWLFPVVCWTLSAYILGSGITYSVISPTELIGAALIPSTRWNWLCFSYYSTAAGVDILIAVSTCWTLAKGRDDCLKETRQLVNRIMLRIVQTGVATSVVAICTLIVSVTSQPSTTWIGLYLALTPLYPMTLLALFNGRVGVKESEARIVEISVESHIYFDEEVGMKSARTVGCR